MKRFLLGCCFLLLLIGVKGVGVSAESAVITFYTEKNEVKVGEEFVVVLSVQGTSTVKAVETSVIYDSRMMTFLEGGKYVTAGSGSLTIQTGELEGEERSRKFSLRFKAIAPGGSVVDISGKSAIMDGEFKRMSVSTNRLSMMMSEEGDVIGNQTSESSGDNGEATPETTPPLSDNNKLEYMRIHTGTLKPAFQTDETSYKATVSNDTVNLFFSVKAEDADAIVTMVGNEGLQVGSNKVKVVVRAPNGSKKTYKINVTRETPEETELRLLEENKAGNTIMDFNVYENGGRVFLENSYRFEVVDVEDITLVPAGFIKTSLRLFGVNFTAYTMENDLENDFLLIYALNENGDKNFYQYDRVEKTMQRYSGDLIEKVNENAVSSKQKTTDEYNANLNQMAIIIAVVAAICVLLLIAMIKMAIRMKGITDDDDLNLK